MGLHRYFALENGGGFLDRHFPVPDAVKCEELAHASADAVIAGHSGMPFTQVFDERLWHNPGVIGMPANDGTPRVWYSVLTPGKSGTRIETTALEYDYKNAAEGMRANGCVDVYARTLVNGIWPADDIMSATDSTRRGIPLQPKNFVWTVN